MDVDNLITTDEYSLEITSLAGHPRPIEVSQRCVHEIQRCLQTIQRVSIQKVSDLLIEEGKTAKEAVLMTGINIKTAQH
jgi:hypothetical protein